MNSLTFLCTLLILFGVNTLMNVIQFHCVLTNCLLGKNIPMFSIKFLRVGLEILIGQHEDQGKMTTGVFCFPATETLLYFPKETAIASMWNIR